MKIRTAALVLSLAAVLPAATAASAGTSAADASRLVLARSDFPAQTKYTWGRMPPSFGVALAAQGIKATNAYYAADLSRGGSTRYAIVSGLVVATGSAAQAREAYAVFKRELRRESMTVLRLPAYGDEQMALFQSPKLGSLAQLLVRRNSVVWQLEIQGGGLLVIPKPTLLAELKKYAAKQNARVGRG